MAQPFEMAMQSGAFARRVRLATSILLLLQAAVGAQRIDAPPEVPGSAAMVGQVVDGVTRLPLAGVVVTLDGPEPVPGAGLIIGDNGVMGGRRSSYRSVRSDARGRFAFADIGAGTYFVSGSGPAGYLDGIYVADGPRRPAQAVALADRERARITIALWPHATVEGTVRDDNGEPLSMAQITFSTRTVVSGRASLAAVARAATDDRGQFSRQLPPGDYIVSATSEELRVREVRGARVTSGFARTFYPAAASVVSAEPILLTPGQIRTGIDLQLPRRPLASLSGVLRNTAGVGVMPKVLRIVSRDGFEMVRGTSVNERGAFTVEHLLPGEYLIEVSFSIEAPGPVPRLWTRTLVTVVAGHNEATIDLRRGLLVRGRLEFDGQDPPSGDVVRWFGLALTPPDYAGSEHGPTTVPVESDGHFAAELPGGRYLAVLGQSDVRSLVTSDVSDLRSWQLRAAWHGGRDVSATPLSVDGDLGDLRLVLSRRTGAVRGRVPSSNSPTFVLLFPDDPSLWQDFGYGRRLLAMRTSRGEFSGQAPEGSYLAVAVRGRFLSEHRDAAVLAALAPLARHVSLVEGQVTTIAAPLVDLPDVSSQLPRALPAPESDAESVQATPSSKPVPTPPGATLAGRIVAADTGQPLANVRVSPSQYASVTMSTYSDQNGRFVLTGVGSGPQTLYFSGQSLANRVLNLNTGAASKSGSDDMPGELTIEMQREALIDVTVLDPAGEPLDAEIGVRQPRWRPGGRTATAPLTFGGLNIVGTRGRYRVSRLPQGDYLLVVRPATPRQDAVPTTTQDDIDRASGATVHSRPPAARDRPWRYAPLFSPGVIDPAQAEPMRLAAGDERALAFRALTVPEVTVGGVLRSSVGATGNFSVSLVPHDSIMTGLGGRPYVVSTDRSGRFSIPNVMPGRYTLAARVGSVPLAAGMRDVVVDGEDLQDIVLDLLPTATITGRLLVDGVTPSSDALSRLAIRASADPPMDFAIASPAAQIETDGRFTLSGVLPGINRLSVQDRSAPFTATLASQLVQGRETIDVGIMVESGASLEGVELRATSMPAELRGVVRRSQSVAGADMYVVLFPNASEHWPSSRRIFAARPDAQGSYTIANVPHGEYFVAVSTGLTPEEWFNPDVLARLRPDARRIVIDKNQVSADLDATPHRP